METIGEKIKRLMTTINMTVGSLAIKSELSRESIYKIIKGDRIRPEYRTLARIATALDMSIDALIANTTYSLESQTGIIYSSNTRRVPVLGTISCGAPLLAEQNIEDYITLPAELAPGCELIALRIKGDSMEGAGLRDGMKALIIVQPTANNGDLVAVCVGEAQNEATIKKISFQDDYITLLPVPAAGNAAEHMPTSHLASQITIIGRVAGTWFG